MKITKVAALLFMALVLPGCVIHVGAQSADVHLQESLSLNASDLTRLEVESGSGVLIIAGKAGVTEISVQADIETSKKRNYELTLQQVGSKAVLVANTDQPVVSGMAIHRKLICKLPYRNIWP